VLKENNKPKGGTTLGEKKKRTSGVPWRRVPTKEAPRLFLTREDNWAKGRSGGAGQKIREDGDEKKGGKWGGNNCERIRKERGTTRTPPLPHDPGIVWVGLKGNARRGEKARGKEGAGKAK